MEKVSGLIRNMPGVCKKCHGQTGSDHAGSRWGFEHCSLLHSDYCLGGITEIPGVRTACPEGFVTKSVESGNDTDISQQRFSDLEDDSDADPDYVPTKNDIKDFVRETKSSTASASSVSFVSSAPVTHSLASVLNTSTTVFAAGNSGFVSTPLTVTSGFGAPVMAPGIGCVPAPGLLNTNFAAAPAPNIASSFGQLHVGSVLGQSTSEVTPTMLFQQFFQQQQAMQLQQQQQQQLQLFQNQKIVQEMRQAVEDAKQAARSAASVRQKTTEVSFNDSVVHEAEKLKVANAKEPSKPTHEIGLNMKNVRDTAGLRAEVEQIMRNEVYTHASLAPPPTAPAVSVASLQLLPNNRSDDSATIARLTAELSIHKQSIAALQKSQQPLSKTDRKAARRAAAEKEAADEKAERRAVRKSANEKLAVARAEIKLAKRNARAVGLGGISSCSDTESDSDDESDLSRTMSRRKRSVKIKAARAVSDTTDSEEDDDIVTDKHGKAYRVVAGVLQPLRSVVKDPVSGGTMDITPSAVQHHGDLSSSSDSDHHTRKEKKMKNRRP